MSRQLFSADVMFFQRFLKCAGLYLGRLDGIWGPKTDAAADVFDAQTQALAIELGTFDRMSERSIRSLQPRAQEAARRFLTRLLDAGISARLLSGTRTYAEQEALYRKGRFGNPPPRVTKARGGQSNHNFGLAWDIGIFRDGAYVTALTPYREAAEFGVSPELEWGGHWKTFVDLPHYQLKTGNAVAVVRARFERGAAYV
jgi:peptidoglycan L-alanyl-D-glutamate endopeptidase CwlK